MNAFGFITSRWQDLQPWATKVRALPRSPTDFAAAYGDFADAADANRTESALISAAEAADLLGSPSDVKQAIAGDGAYLTSTTAPKMLYGRLVWWALQVQNAATLVDQTLSSMATVTADGSATPDDVRTLLTDPSAGLTAALDSTVASGRDIATQLGNLKDRLLPQIQTFAGTKTVSAANQALSRLNAQLADLRDQAAAQYRVWKHEDLGPGDPPPVDTSDADASTSLISWPFGKGKERKAKAEYARIVAEMAALRDSGAPKEKFVADVRGLDVAGLKVVPAIGELAAGVGKVVDTLDGLATRARSVASSASDEQLTDHAWLTKALAAEATVTLGRDAQEFVTQALVETPPAPAGGTTG
jgi:hypothetical protein